MKYLRIELTNWGPHKQRVLEIDPKAKVIAIAGENDKGKSWIIRALAGIFVTGKNEYFDKQAIHEGEDQAEVKVNFLDNQGKEHEVIRVLRKKETEGTDEIHLNGEQVSPTEYSNFLCELFQTTDTKILLSLAISMQGETHFYLKAKRRDREEGMRALTQLDRIDTWKEHLTRLVNAEDKNLAEIRNNLLGQKLTLEESLKNTLEKIETLQKEELTLLSGQNHDGTKWELQTQINAIEKWRKNLENIATLQREVENLRSNIALHEETLGKTKEEKEKSPLKGLTHEEIQDKEDSLTQEEVLLRETRIWKRALSKEQQVQQSEKQIQDLQKLLAHTKLPLEEREEKTLQEQLDITKLSENSLKLLPKPEKTQKDLEEELKSISSLETQAKTQEENLRIATQNQDRIQRLLQGTLLEFEINPKEKSIQEIENLCKETIAALKTGIQSKRISKPEANLLKQRILTNWKNSTPLPCPICEEDLTQHKGWETQESRKAALEILQKELASLEEEGELQLPGGEEIKKLIALETLLKEDLPAAIEAEKQTNILLKNAEGKETSLALQKRKETTKKLLDQWENYQKASQINEEESKKLSQLCQQYALNQTPQENKTPQNKAKEILLATQKIRIKISEIKQNIQSKEEILKTSKNELDEIQKELPKEKNAKIKILLLEEETTLREEYSKITKELETLRKQRNNLKPILEKLQELEKKVTELKTQKSEKEKSLSEAKTKSLWTLGAIPTEPNQTEESAAKVWENKQKRSREIKILLTEEKPKVEEIQKKIQSTKADIEKIDQDGADIQAAQELTKFLDYKNAPRKLLSRTIDQIFHRANKLARGFNLEMVLSQGKNLEFNVVQLRDGKEILQKTERLGFGKANILGINTRLAAQEILAPATGFLVLDEPSAYVDTLRKNSLREFLEKLSQEGEKKDTQIIIVEHEESIAQAANQILWIN